MFVLLQFQFSSTWYDIVSPNIEAMDEFEAGPFEEDPPMTNPPGRGKGKGGRGGKGRGTRPSKTPLDKAGICPGCMKQCCAKKRFCEGHNTTWDNMVYQARTSKLRNEDGSVKLDENDNEMTKLADFNEKMRDEASAGQAVLDQAVNEPADKKYRKHPFIDWARFERKWGQRSEIGEQDKTVPMTRRVFECWAKNTQGEDDEQAIAEWWQELDEDPHIERDNKGRRGEKQLFVPHATEKFRRKYKYQGSDLIEGSSQSKAPK